MISKGRNELTDVVVSTQLKRHAKFLAVVEEILNWSFWIFGIR